MIRNPTVKFWSLASAAACTASVPDLALAASGGRGLPQTITAVTQCVTIADNTERLACYDSAAEKLGRALQQKQVVVAERAEIEQTQRSLFGLPVDGDAMLGGEPISRIEANVVSVAQDRDGRWRVTLEGGATWQQVDYDYVNKPKVGATATLRKASLGGYEISVPGSRPFRCIRTR